MDILNIKEGDVIYEIKDNYPKNPSFNVYTVTYIISQKEREMWSEDTCLCSVIKYDAQTDQTEEVLEAEFTTTDAKSFYNQLDFFQKLNGVKKERIKYFEYYMKELQNSITNVVEHIDKINLQAKL
jgi:hypothetical protein